MRLVAVAMFSYLLAAPLVCFAEEEPNFGQWSDPWRPAWETASDDEPGTLSQFFEASTRSRNLSAFEQALIRGQSPSSDSSGGSENLTAKANDPTAALISFNVQNFFTTESYDASGHGYMLNLLPVIPIQQKLLGFDYMITRPSIPIFGPSVDPVGPIGATSGMGDIFVTNLLIKKESWGAWGIGPSVNFPTATDPALGSREWQIAPSAVVVLPTADGKWMFGGLVLAPISLQSNAKSISLQPIAVRFLPNDWYVSNGFQVWNWQTDNGNFNMPLTLRVGRVLKQFKPFPLNVSMQSGYTPEDWHQGPAARWQFLFNITVLMPAG